MIGGLMALDLYQLKVFWTFAKVRHFTKTAERLYVTQSAVSHLLGKLRTIVGKLLILSPGVGAQGGSAAEALRNGADFVIAGRSIYQSPDPRGAAERLVEEVRRSGV